MKEMTFKRSRLQEDRSTSTFLHPDLEALFKVVERGFNQLNRRI
jgi:hypothetical protein